MTQHTQSAAELAKELEPAPCQTPCDRLRCRAARAIEALAAECSEYRDAIRNAVLVPRLLIPDKELMKWNNRLAKKRKATDSLHLLPKS